MILLMLVAFMIGYAFGSRKDNQPLVCFLVNHFLGCNKSNPCPCCASTQVMFLPDEMEVCTSFFNELMDKEPKGCNFEVNQKKYNNRFRPRVPCKYNHARPNEPPSALIEIFKTLNNAQESIRICMYLIKLKEMVAFLAHLKKSKNIAIQIVTNSKWDEKKAGGHGSPRQEIRLLQKAGVEVKTNDEAMMHNKFVIIDDKILISGSPNWTWSAFRNNDEAIIFTTQSKIVGKFLDKFATMWEQMNLYEEMPVTQMEHVCFLARVVDSGADSDDNWEKSGLSKSPAITRIDSSLDDIMDSSEADVESSEEGISFRRSKRLSSSSNCF